jgi:serine/threonine protein kinase
MQGEVNGTEVTVGRYVLHREIAKGGMARIHIARSIGSHGFTRLVAAKRLDPELAHDQELVEMFLDEARLASKIRHPNVVPVLDVVSIGGETIMVQELVHGVALHKLCRRAQEIGARIPIEIAVSIATQVLAGLHAAHEAVDETGESLCIVHRDVSPQNVMIATDGTARLLDFGVAKASRVAQSHITQTGTFKGKVSYSSPEHLQGKATPQSDVYSLAIVLWEMLVGQRLHAGYDREVFVTIMESTPPSLTDALAEKHAAFEIDDRTWSKIVALEPILRRAFARDLAERFATAAEMQRALHAVVTPAPLADVTAWMRSLAQDLIAMGEQMIAQAEQSWRKWGSKLVAAVKLADGSGMVRTPAANGAVELRQSSRNSTSIETMALKPSACARLSESTIAVNHRATPTQRARLLDAAAIAVLVVLFVASSLYARSEHAAAPSVTSAVPSIWTDITLPDVEVVNVESAPPPAIETEEPTPVERDERPTVKPRKETRRTSRTTDRRR